MNNESTCKTQMLSIYYYYYCLFLRVVVDKTDAQKQLGQPFVWCFVGVGMAPSPRSLFSLSYSFPLSHP